MNEESNQNPPWERQPWDSKASYEAFLVYLEMGSVPEAYRKKTGKSTAKQAPGSWNNWAAAKNYNGEPIPGALTWAQRVEAWENHLHLLELQKWQRRRLEHKEAGWTLSKKLRDRVERMLMFPISEQVTTQGPQGTTTIIKPLKWSANDIARLTETADKLARLTLGEPTDTSRGANINIDVSNLTQEQLQRIATGEDPVQVLAETSEAS